jgi:hypothetical protein
MTTFSPARRQTPTPLSFRLAFAAVLLIGIVGIAASALPRLVGADQPDGAMSPRDQMVLKAAQDWEARYRQMYPN